MSRAFNMSVHISAFQPDRREAIRGAAGAEWPFVWSVNSRERLLGDADGSLAGGESEQDFVDRLSLAIWRTNGAYCDLQVEATYLECHPYEIYAPSERDYRRLLTPRPQPRTGASHALPDRS